MYLNAHNDFIIIQHLHRCRSQEIHSLWYITLWLICTPNHSVAHKTWAFTPILKCDYTPRGVPTVGKAPQFWDFDRFRFGMY